jgi:hypothetical protein
VNFTVRPPATIQDSDLIPLNQLLKPRGFRLLASNKGTLAVTGEGFRQEAITAIYGYFSAKRKCSQSIVENDDTGE